MSEQTRRPALSIDNVFAGYGGGDILRGLTLEVEEGSLTCLVGPNGAGKSTVLAVLSGLLNPRAGTIKYGDVSLTGLAPREIIKLGICLVAQGHSLFPGMTVRENVELGGLTLGDRREVSRRRQALEEEFPLIRERHAEKVGSLSGGQQKLVEIVRALILDPAIILFDEPSAGLDPQRAADVYRTVKRLNESGRTILLVEQNVRAGLRLATRAAVLEGGRVKLEGTGAELLADSRTAALYLGGSVDDEQASARSTAPLGAGNA